MNIRQKILAALVVCLLAVILVAALSLSRLAAIENKLEVVEMASDLADTVLEARRYEKNYLLYAQAASLGESQRYAAMAVSLIESIETKSRSLEALTRVRKVKEGIGAYHAALLAVSPSGKSSDIDQPTEERLRTLGKSIVDGSLSLVSYERTRIYEIIGALRAQMLTAVSGFLVMTTLLIYLVRRMILQPLGLIEATTRRIAKGKFQTINVPRRRDETGRVLEAFNTMVRELEKRQDQLVQAKKLSSIGTLAAGIAHQLNNPLNNISTSCQIAIEEFEEDDRAFQFKILQNIDKETQRASEIVRGLLEFSRVKDFELRPTRIKEVLEASVRLVSSQVPSGVFVLIEVPDDLEAQLDRQNMQEALINLIVNAAQAIKELPGEIRLKAMLDDAADIEANPDGKEVVLTVADTGPGVPAHLLGHIFDPFFTTKEIGVGTGLGLSIVYGIVKKHGGTVGVESVDGLGATFTIRLPWKPRQT